MEEEVKGLMATRRHKYYVFPLLHLNNKKKKIFLRNQSRERKLDKGKKRNVL